MTGTGGWESASVGPQSPCSGETATSWAYGAVSPGCGPLPSPFQTYALYGLLSGYGEDGGICRAAGAPEEGLWPREGD